MLSPEAALRRVFLKKGRERPVLRGHPWIFSGAIERVEEEESPSPVTEILESQGKWLARGLWNPASQIKIRVLTWAKEEIDPAFFTRRLAQAIALREKYLASRTNACRLVNGEGDLLPGLVVDRYGGFLVCQFFTSGMDQLKGMVVESLLELCRPEGIYERSEGGVREEEGLSSSVGLLAGEEPPQLIEIEENGIKFLVDIRRGQKTGFFLDQRDNRSLLLLLARNKTVLNCFAYTGAFTVAALKGGARRAVSVDASKWALDLAKRNLELNGFAPLDDLFRADAFSFLKACEEKFDLVILDPPSLAPKRADLEGASGGYKYLNLHALRILNPGGLLFTFCCSQHVSAELFQKIVFGATVDSGRKAQILRRVGLPADHPVSLHHPEGEYLKGFLLRLLE